MKSWVEFFSHLEKIRKEKKTELKTELENGPVVPRPIRAS